MTKVDALMTDKRLGRMEHPSQPLFNTAVLEQQTLIPGIYGDVDFNQLPERYEQAFDINRLRPSKHRDYCQRVLERPELIELIRNYTMTGDAVADAYAALIPEYGFKTLVTMLEAPAIMVSKTFTMHPKSSLLSFAPWKRRLNGSIWPWWKKALNTNESRWARYRPSRYAARSSPHS